MDATSASHGCDVRLFSFSQQSGYEWMPPLRAMGVMRSLLSFSQQSGYEWMPPLRAMGVMRSLTLFFAAEWL